VPSTQTDSRRTPVRTPRSSPRPSPGPGQPAPRLGQRPAGGAPTPAPGSARCRRTPPRSARARPPAPRPDHAAGPVMSPGPGNPRSTPGRRTRTAASHCLAALTGAAYLAHAEPGRLSSVLRLSRELTSDPAAVVIRQVASRAGLLPPERRARRYALTAAHLGVPDLKTQLTQAFSHQLMPAWAHSPVIPHTEVTGHSSSVTAVAAGRAGTATSSSPAVGMALCRSGTGPLATQ
jgi:hypothetical protein